MSTAKQHQSQPQASSVASNQPAVAPSAAQPTSAKPVFTFGTPPATDGFAPILPNYKSSTPAEKPKVSETSQNTTTVKSISAAANATDSVKPAQKKTSLGARIVAFKEEGEYQFVKANAPSVGGHLDDDPWQAPHLPCIMCEAANDGAIVLEDALFKNNPYELANLDLANGEYRFRFSRKASALLKAGYSEKITSIAKQLATFLVSEKTKTAEQAKVFVATECSVSLLEQLEGSLLAITVPPDSVRLEHFKPKVNGEDAKCVVEPSLEDPRYQTLLLAPVTASSAPRILIKHLHDMLKGRNIILRELWRWHIEDDEGQIVMLTGKFHALLELRSSESPDDAITEPDAFKIMQALPGWLDLGCNTIKLYHFYRFDYCDRCKIDYSTRHTKDACSKTMSEPL